jgi:hypothetical protein
MVELPGILLVAVRVISLIQQLVNLVSSKKGGLPFLVEAKSFRKKSPDNEQSMKTASRNLAPDHKDSR